MKAKWFKTAGAVIASALLLAACYGSGTDAVDEDAVENGEGDTAADEVDAVEVDVEVEADVEADTEAEAEAEAEAETEE